MTPRERFLRAIHFEEPDRVPHAVQFWAETIDDWYARGELKMDLRAKGRREYGPLPVGVLDYNVLCPLYGLDMMPPWVAGGPFFGTNFSPMLPERVLEEGDTWRVVCDEWGVTKRVRKDGRSVPQFLDWPVKNREDLERFKAYFDPEDPRRYAEGWERRVKSVLETGSAPIGWGFPGFFGTARWLLGLERLLIAFMRDQALLRALFDFWSDFVLKLAKRALELQVDYMGVWEDMAYKNGPMVPPRLFKELMVPYYKKVTYAFRQKGVDLALVDSDGNINSLIPLWLEGGVNGFVPLESQAGMDAVALRDQYGDKVVLMGNISLWALRNGPSAIEEELRRKFPALLPGGGYIASTDHHIPPDVSYGSFLHYLGRVQKWGEYPYRKG
ncbi:MAG: uroporphyrinogen decarboxylase family protein [Candidatus Bathyarchaeia archaeon]